MRTRRLLPLRFWLLLLALLGAQTLGLVHSVLHAYQTPHVLARSATFGAVRSVGTQALQTDVERWGWLAYAFADHGAGECRLFDQLAHGDQAPPASPAQSLAQLSSPGVPCRLPEFWVTAKPAPFEARAPPAPLLLSERLHA